MLFTSKLKKFLPGIFLLIAVSGNSTNLFANSANKELSNKANSKIVSIAKNKAKADSLDYQGEKPLSYYTFGIDSQYANLPCQSLIYLTKPEHNSEYSFWYLKEKIKDIGQEKIEKIANNALVEEISRKDSHYVFYHGQPLEFLLLQDIFDHVYKILAKKALDNFIALRLPTKDLTDYPTVQAFLSKFNNRIDDSEDPARKLLLSVTPTFFGINMSYFLNSETAFPINNTNLIQKTFEYFKISNLFEKYHQEIINIQDLLSMPHKEKTGLLVQIFVPKTLADYVSYKSHPGGTPFNYYAPTKTTDELESAKNDPFILNKQFRLFLNPKLFSQENITMLRYYNKTPNTKKYKQAVSDLFKKLAKDILE